MDEQSGPPDDARSMGVPSQRPSSETASGLAQLAKMFQTISEAGGSEVTADVRHLDLLTGKVVDVVSGADGASVTVLRRARFETVSATDRWVRSADDVQYRLGSGPCVDAIVTDSLFRPQDLLQDSRWPEFGRQVATKFGVRSMLSFRLFTQVEDVAAALNVYSRSRAAFTDHDVSLGLVLATVTSFAVAAEMAREDRRQFETALETSRDIGAAIGILMAQHKVTKKEAFGLLKMASQDANRKLRDIALDVVDTGVLELRAGRLRSRSLDR